LLDRIHEGLKTSSYFAVLLSKAAVSSNWVRHELKTAVIDEINAGVNKVLPIVIDECQIPEYLSDKFYLDMRDEDSYKENLELLLERITGISRAGLGIQKGEASASYSHLSLERCFEKISPMITSAIVKQFESLTFRQRGKVAFDELVTAAFREGVLAIERYHKGLLIPIDVFVERRVTQAMREILKSKIHFIYRTSQKKTQKLIETIWQILGNGELDSDGKQWWVKAVGGLSEAQKKVFVLYFYEQLTIDEVSEVLERPPSEITQMLSQGIEQLEPIIHELEG